MLQVFYVAIDHVAVKFSVPSYPWPYLSVPSLLSLFILLEHDTWWSTHLPLNFTDLTNPTKMNSRGIFFLHFSYTTLSYTLKTLSKHILFKLLILTIKQFILTLQNLVANSRILGYPLKPHSSSTLAVDPFTPYLHPSTNSCSETMWSVRPLVW